jgi:predicted AlkP superfamily pyrophosphatase or phosphodiesterase
MLQKIVKLGLLTIAMASTCITHAQKCKYVVMVSIDGFRPDFYLNEEYPTPNLKFFKENGVYAQGVNGVFPTVTYPSHTTLVTGATPAVHGVYYNTPFEPNGVTGLWNSQFSLIKIKTIWQAAKDAGLKTASVSWPVTEGAPIDYNLPETFTLKNPGDRRQPTSELATPKGLFEEVQENATGKMTAMDLNLNYFKMDENLGRMAAYIMRTYRPNLMTVHLPTTDKAQHSQGRSGSEVKFTLATADRAIGAILESFKLAGIQDSAAIIVTGDHGFVDTHTTMSPNTWLVAAGLLPEKLAAGSDWKAMFQATGGSAFLKVKNKGDKATVQKVYDILQRQPESIKKLFTVLDGEALRNSGCDPEAVLALLPVQGISVRGNTTGPLLLPSVGGTHGYYPNFKEIQTGFVAYGAGIGKAVVPVMSLTDVAPTIMHLLNVPFTSDAGLALPGVFSGEANR